MDLRTPKEKVVKIGMEIIIVGILKCKNGYKHMHNIDALPHSNIPLIDHILI